MFGIRVFSQDYKTFSISMILGIHEGQRNDTNVLLGWQRWIRQAST